MSRTVRVPLEKLSAGERRLPAPATRYLVAVLRLRPGDRFVAFDPEARAEADAVLKSLEHPCATCCVEALRPATRVSALRLTLVQGLGKGDTVEQVLRASTALGVTRVVMAETERSVARGKSAQLGRSERWRAIVLDTARQCQRGDLPSVVGPCALTEEIEAWGRRDARKLCLHPEATLALHTMLADFTGQEELVLLIGPEGGLSAGELELAERAGFTLVRLGPFTLRSELAAAAALGAVLSHGER